VADSVLKSYLVSLGFQTTGGAEAKRSIKDHEAAVVAAERAIEAARDAGAKTADEIAKRGRERDLKAAREALATAQATEKAEAELAARRKERFQAFAAGLAGVALAAGAAAGAVAHAVGKMAGSLDGLRVDAEKTDGPAQALKAVEAGYRSVGAAAGEATAAAQSFAARQRANPGLRNFVRSNLGVGDDVQGVDRMRASAKALLARNPLHVAYAQAENLGIPSTALDLERRHGSEIDARVKAYNTESASRGANFDDMAKQARPLFVALEKLGDAVEMLATKLLAALAPVVEKLVAQFQGWIDANPGAIKGIIEQIVEAAKKIGEALGTVLEAFVGNNSEISENLDKFGAKMRGLVKSLDDFAVGIQELIKFFRDPVGYAATKALQATGLGGPDGGKGAAPTSDQAMPDGSTKAGGKLADNQKELHSELLKLGYSDTAARAITANASGESLRNPADHHWDRSHMASGIFQWDPQRSAAIQKQFGKMPHTMSIAEQAAAFKWETENNPAYAKTKEALAGDHAGTMLNTLVKNFERPQDVEKAVAERSAFYRGFDPNAAPATSSGPGGDPLDGKGRVTSRFGMRDHPILGGRRMHKGIDLAAPEGTNVKAMLDGIVSIGRSGDVTIRNSDGSSQVYRHVVPSVADGARIAAGAIIARIGPKDGRSTGAHLHIEARDKDGNPFDPAPLLGGRGASPQARPAARNPAAPNMSPGGFDVNAGMKPAAPMGLGVGAINTSNDNSARTFAPVNTTNVTVHGADRPAETAKHVSRAVSDVETLRQINAKSALA
jgi:murein DD-endopeptidase MepM/ murein hydrolase activator NlpD